MVSPQIMLLFNIGRQTTDPDEDLRQHMAATQRGLDQKRIRFLAWLRAREQQLAAEIAAMAETELGANSGLASDDIVSWESAAGAAGMAGRSRAQGQGG